ncbi:hypothetical protein [Leifsonia sp. NPDC080035]|uniref:Uncharacterized protein n=1 Tax=Leifsonia sp. NPDC080035 TaxID=3143936 RepID=A0AAU7GBA8_9MICO
MATALTTDSAMRGLLFVRLMNAQGIKPKVSEVEAYASTPLPAGVMDYLGQAWGFNRQVNIVQYLTDAGFVIVVGREVHITPIGVAFCDATEELPSARKSVEAKPLEVVGRLEDPVTYAELLAEVDKCKDSLVVEPYIPPAEFASLLKLPEVKRVLTKETYIIQGGKRVSVTDRRRNLAIALGGRSDAELRVLPKEIKELHDRYVLPSSGSGLMVGTSLGGSQLTVVVHLSEDSTQTLLQHYDELWAKAEVVEPIGREALDSPTGDA